MKRIALLAGLVAAISGCRTELPPQVSKEPRFERTELVVMRQVSGYSDIALMSEEEGTFIWTHQQVSPFGIQLSFGNASDPERSLHTVYFATDSSTISNRERGRLNAVISNLPPDGVVLSGYADPRASSAYNLALSKRRVQSITDYLRGKGVTVAFECAYGKDRLPNPDLCEERQNDK